MYSPKSRMNTQLLYSNSLGAILEGFGFQGYSDWPKLKKCCKSLPTNPQKE